MLNIKYVAYWSIFGSVCSQHPQNGANFKFHSDSKQTGNREACFFALLPYPYQPIDPDQLAVTS